MTTLRYGQGLLLFSLHMMDTIFTLSGQILPKDSQHAQGSAQEEEQCGFRWNIDVADNTSILKKTRSRSIEVSYSLYPT